MSSPSSANVRRTWVTVGLFLGWTGFVWAGRMRNAVSDETLTDSEQRASLLLASSFLVPAAMLAVVLALVVRARGADDRLSRTLTVGTCALALWTAGLWVVRAVDIALFSDNEVGFIVVHVVLAVVSITLAALAVRSLSGTPERGTRPVRSHRHEGVEVRGD